MLEPVRNQKRLLLNLFTRSESVTLCLGDHWQISQGYDLCAKVNLKEVLDFSVSKPKNQEEMATHKTTLIPKERDKFYGTAEQTYRDTVFWSDIRFRCRSMPVRSAKSCVTI